VGIFPENVVQIPPLVFEADGCLVFLLEVLKGSDMEGNPRYHVSLRVKCGDIESKTFNLTVKDTKELKALLLAEITKFKLMRMVLGDEMTRRVIG